MMSAIFIILAAICNRLMDNWMMKYLNLSDAERNEDPGTWWAMDPLAKWGGRVWGRDKAYNVLLLKIGIRTTWGADTCNESWHFFKFLMLSFLFLAVSVVWLEFALYGLLWIIAFDLTEKITSP